MKRILTGDRPTGKLHLGHYVGTLKNRVALQNDYETFIILADLHTLTTKPEKEHIQKLNENIRELMLDYLAVGLDPEKVIFYRQSEVPEVAYLHLLFSMLVTKERLERLPTLKEVMRDLKIANASLGLLAYPVLQAADILMVRANVVPVGKDQQSHVELTREIATRFNSMYGEVFPIPEALVPKGYPSEGTLVGTDGKAKMSKSLGNCIYLSDSTEEVKKKVMSMYTDPSRIHGNEPGQIEGNPVFIYHDIFNLNTGEVADLKSRYQKGAVKDVEVKEKLAAAINVFLDPIRKKRAEFEKDPKLISRILEEGTARARAEAETTLKLAKEAMGF
ncbi:MAG: tryptophan--tRNA ligase [Parcubacteria group bacterium]|uniref:Tryptophan--tRNA ligase n=1 Tax=Candidatus Sungiibacteriota bacterium TaxID=2750080 RepID=A0A9D6DS12_9BACT|nr:tryptophan--tRNA ligase [Candidatus Sungbacteria bacterium]MBI4119157.1 tryptophan--tRNA ligase [Parcubacteria group bacterium]